MNFDDISVEKKFLLDYLKKSNLESCELDGLTNLYRSYLLISVLMEKGVAENKTLLDYENEIYTVGGKTMTDIQKIEFELKRIDKKFDSVKNDMSSSFEVSFMESEILNLKRIFLEYSGNFDKTTLHYLKKNISLIQARLGLRNYFLSDSYNAFLDKYINLYVGETHGLERKLR